MIKIQKFKIFFLFSTLYFVFFTLPVLATEVYFETPGNELEIGKSFEIGVFLNTEGESINAIEGEIIFPAGTLELQQINDGGSFVSFWVKKPVFNQNSVIFSGILPGGYEGRNGYLFSLIFKANELGEAIIDAKNILVLKNEPAGEPASTKILSLQLSISEQSSVPAYVAPEDTEPPEVFTPQIVRDPNLFDGKWFLVFAAKDKGSGIDHYEVQENKKQKIEKGKWTLAESPYVLKDQQLESYVYVKAIDKTVNERVITLSPKNQPAWYEKYFLQIIFGAVIIVLGALIFILRKTIWSRLPIKK